MKTSILLVEDEAIIATAEKLMLERHGFHVAVALGPTDALDLFAKDATIDFVLMDVDLGHGLDGTEVARQMLAQRDIPVVFLSSHTEPDLVARAERITSYGYVVKSCSETVLVAAIRMAVRLFESRQREREKDAQLKEHQDRLLSLINSTPDIICFKDGDGRWLQANNADLELFSLTDVDYRGKTDAELAELTDPIFATSFTTCRESDEAAWRTGSLSVTREMIPRPDGTSRVYSVIKRPVFDCDGSRNGLIVFGRDITEQAQYEDALKRSQANLLALIENTEDMIWSVDRGYRLIAGNNRFHEGTEAMVGKRLEPGDDVFDTTAPASIRRTWRGYYDRALAGERFTIDYPAAIPADDPPIIEYRFTPIRDVEGAFNGVTAAGRTATADRADRKRREWLEELVRVAFDRNPMPMALNGVDDGTYYEVNQAFTRLTGYRREEVIGIGVVDLGLIDAETSREAQEELEQNGMIEHRAVAVTRKDGTTRVCRFFGEMVETGGYRYLLTLAEDISAARRTETELEQALREKDVLLSEINHRVKNNLSMVSSLISLKDTAAGPGVDLSDLRAQIDAIRMVHEKLTAEPGSGVVDLNHYLKELLGALFEPVDGTTVDVTVDVPPARMPPSAIVPLGLILAELATNARKHAFRSGTREAFTVAASLTGHRTAVVTVSNTGLPFPEETDTERSDSLGLTLVRSLVQQLGGTVELHRRPQTTFVITVPHLDSDGVPS